MHTNLINVPPDPIPWVTDQMARAGVFSHADDAQRMKAALDVLTRNVSALHDDEGQYRVALSKMATAATNVRERIVQIGSKPLNDDTLTDGQKAAVLMGLVLHEVGHIRWSRNYSAALKKYGTERTGAVAAISNLTADHHNEYAAMDLFPGLAYAVEVTMWWVSRTMPAGEIDLTSVGGRCNAAIAVTRYPWLHDWDTEPEWRDWWTDWAGRAEKQGKPKQHVDLVNEAMAKVRDLPEEPGDEPGEEPGEDPTGGDPSPGGEPGEPDDDDPDGDPEEGDDEGDDETPTQPTDDGDEPTDDDEPGDDPTGSGDDDGDDADDDGDDTEDGDGDDDGKGEAPAPPSEDGDDADDGDDGDPSDETGDGDPGDEPTDDDGDDADDPTDEGEGTDAAKPQDDETGTTGETDKDPTDESGDDIDEPCASKAARDDDDDEMQQAIDGLLAKERLAAGARRYHHSTSKYGKGAIDKYGDLIPNSKSDGRLTVIARKRGKGFTF